MCWHWDDGGYSPCGEVPVSDRGFRYGMSVFASIRVLNGAPVFFREHLDRLRTACERCGFAPDPAALDQSRDLLRDDGFARIYVTAGDGTVTSPIERCRVFVFNERREPIAGRVYHRGYDLGIAPEPHQPLFGGLKTGNYWANLDTCRGGVARSKNETLLFNHAGGLISACMANVFVARAGKIKTPSCASGARAGVVREWVMRRREVGECALTKDDLADADEIFLTSSWLGIMPVASLEDRRLPDNFTARQLHAEYEQLLSTPSF